MLGSTILETAIGLVFVYLLFSLLISAINEAVLGHLTHLRSRVLENSLKALLSDEGSKTPPAGQWIKTLGAILASPVRLFIPKKAPVIGGPRVRENPRCDSGLARAVVHSQKGAGHRRRAELRGTFAGASPCQGSGTPRKHVPELPRSEERRVGKECRSRWSPDH